MKHTALAFLTLIMWSGFAPGSALAATRTTPSPDPTHPRVMQQAANQVATTPTGSLQPFAPVAPLPAVGGPGNLQREVFGFALASSLADPTFGYPSWNFSLLTTVAFFGLHVNDDGTFASDSGWNVWNSSQLSDLLSTAHSHATKVVLTIILQDFGAGTPHMCAALGHTATTVANTVAEVKAKGVDGVNVDYEGLNDSCGTTDPSWARSNFTGFVASLRSSLPGGSYLSVDTYASSAADPAGFFDIGGMGPSVDSFFVMAYDLEYANYLRSPLSCSSFCLGPTAPLTGYYYNDTSTASQYMAAVPASKVILGVPYYGRKACVASPTPNQYPNGSVVADTYLDASTELSVPGPGFQPGSYAAHRDANDAAGQERWDTWVNTNLNCTRELYWDDTVSLGLKYDLVNRDNLRGVGIWNLNYGGGAPELWQSLWNSLVHFTCPGTNFMVGDFTGDKKADLAVIGSQGVCVLASTGAAFSIPSPWASIPFYGSKATLAGDVTGDGKADVVAVNAGQTFVMPSTGTALAPVASWATVPFYGSRGTFLADVNGDAKADLVAINDSSVWVMLSTGSSFGPPMQWSTIPFYGSVTTTVGDVTGDGKADLVAVNSDGTWVMTSTGSGFGAPAMWSNQPFYGTVMTTVGDVNGDGKADLVAANSGSTWVMTSTGTGFAAPAQWSGTPFYGLQATLRGDVTGDGKADLVAVNETSVWVAPSTGSALSAPAQWFAGPP